MHLCHGFVFFDPDSQSRHVGVENGLELVTQLRLHDALDLALAAPTDQAQRQSEGERKQKAVSCQEGAQL